MEERLQKFMARAGLGSRRTCEDLISQGRVEVNGQMAQLGQKVDAEHDLITVDSQLVRLSFVRVCVALHKPRGVLSDNGDGSGRRPTARDMVPLPGHMFPVGRLDLESEGLLLITNDGELCHRLTHPRYEHSKEYHVNVDGHPSERTLKKWRAGIFLDGRRTAPADVAVIRRERHRTWLQVVLREGRKRQIRRVGAALGHPVHRLIRVRVGPMRLGDLKPGEWRSLTYRELGQLDDFTNQTRRVRSRGSRRDRAAEKKRDRSNKT